MSHFDAKAGMHRSRHSAARKRGRERFSVRSQRLKFALAALKRVQKLARYPFANGVAWSQLVLYVAVVTCAPLSASATAAARKLVNQVEHVTNARNGQDEQRERARLIELLPRVLAKLEHDINGPAA